MGALTPFGNEPMDNSALTLLPSLPFHALTESHCFRIYCLPWEDLVGVGLREELWLHRRSGFPLPYCISGGKVGLKPAKTYLQDVITFIFYEACVDS